MNKNKSITETWKKRWEESYNKWNEAIRLTTNNIAFSNKRGFDNLTIVNMCGYCKEFYNESGCNKCPLNKKWVCRKRPDNNIFWQYVTEMRKGIARPSLVNWSKAILLATRIRNVIEEDRPI